MYVCVYIYIYIYIYIPCQHLPGAEDQCAEGAMETEMTTVEAERRFIYMSKLLGWLRLGWLKVV